MPRHSRVKMPQPLLKILAGKVLLHILVLHKHVVAVAELTLELTARMNVLEQKECILHLVEGARICELTFRIVRNNGPANRVVVVATEFMPSPIMSTATRQNENVASPFN